jgi:hypothetical protein
VRKTGKCNGNPPFRNGAKGWATHIWLVPMSVVDLAEGGELAGEGVEGEAAEEVAAEAALDLVEAA